MSSQADQLFARNIDHAGSIKYNLNKVHSASVVSNLEKISIQLMIDSQSLSVALRATAAFHEDSAKVLLSNVAERSKDIGEFTLLVTNMGEFPMHRSASPHKIELRTLFHLRDWKVGDFLKHHESFLFEAKV
jgi:hypothetical protein